MLIYPLKNICKWNLIVNTAHTFVSLVSTLQILLVVQTNIVLLLLCIPSSTYM